MKPEEIIAQLSKNSQVFKGLLADIPEEEQLWRIQPEKWCLLEIVCHLYDEEREDFRLRTRQILENPELPLPPFDPVAWVTERKYMQQNYDEKLASFLSERKQSIAWLQSLKDPEWVNAYQHPKMGALSANHFLSNWLAHDYLHIRQILRVKFDFLKNTSEQALDYAGKW